MASSDLITFPLEMPDEPAFREISWVNENVVAVNTSPLNLYTQRYEWEGKRHSVTIKLPPMNYDLARKWFSFFGKLSGRAGTFYLTDSACNLRKAGLVLGQPETDGVSTGRILNSRGWNPCTQYVLRSGDWVQFYGRMYRVLDDAHSDADGKTSFPVWPNIRSVPDGVPVEWRKPRGVFMLNDEPDMNQGVDRFISSVTFSAVEVLR